MNLTFSQLKKIFPELNRKKITPSQVLQVFAERNIELYEVRMEGRGACVTDSGREYIFLKESLTSLLYHETLCYEGVHALCHHPASFLRWRHNLQSEVFSLVMMMPKTDLPRLNRIKHQLDDESYELLQRRNKANEMWKI